MVNDVSKRRDVATREIGIEEKLSAASVGNPLRPNKDRPAAARDYVSYTQQLALHKVTSSWSVVFSDIGPTLGMIVGPVAKKGDNSNCWPIVQQRPIKMSTITATRGVQEIPNALSELEKYPTYLARQKVDQGWFAMTLPGRKHSVTNCGKAPKGAAAMVETGCRTEKEDMGLYGVQEMPADYRGGRTLKGSKERGKWNIRENGGRLVSRSLRTLIEDLLYIPKIPIPLTRHTNSLQPVHNNEQDAISLRENSCNQSTEQVRGGKGEDNRSNFEHRLAVQLNPRSEIATK
ncbi:hypothetical protein WN55_07028 [Dufourea novaeangliae]|uniref:Uncharacterized protein n=1 Tax=Dufourea novaeangliae TaxID=178035 RepID=A0A154PRK0_DUFNO|nr:hypothetical protein WN55_07028 [Dufourea novaeangliae]